MIKILADLYNTDLETLQKMAMGIYESESATDFRAVSEGWNKEQFAEFIVTRTVDWFICEWQRQNKKGAK